MNSGASREGREQLALALDYVREGDTFVVTRLDRLARSVGDLLAILKQLESKGVAFRCIQQPGVDTTGPMGKLLLTILGAFAEFENGIRKERQMDGIARAKREGVYKGRPAKIDADEIRALKESGMGPAKIAKHLKIGRASVYRALAPA
jgi:DNA invertase Pin-like site-specific DNA recombinase